MPQRARSAEQTARLLLSSAYRHDTWECATAKELAGGAGGDVTTVCLRFVPPKSTEGLDALNLVLFDAGRRAFVGASYRLPASALGTPVVFQAAPAQTLVVEVLARDRRPASLAAPGGFRATQYGTCHVRDLASTPYLSLRPGNARLLMLEPAVWPAESLPSAVPARTLPFACQLNHDRALAATMRELVPPGVFVPESFTQARPASNARTFSIELPSVVVTPGAAPGAADGLGLAESGARWSVAAVAHNGYQQLGKGVEAPLRREGGGDDDDSYYYYSDDDRNKKNAASGPVTLCTEFPVRIEGLPVHSATALVLAVRRRRAGEAAAAVVGLCVFPLCMMPMQDRDVRVERLPALQGPFSCGDARMMMVEPSAPYGKVPLTLTVTVAYHDTLATAAPVTAAAAGAEAGRPGEGEAAAPEEITRDDWSQRSGDDSSSGSGRDGEAGRRPSKHPHRHPSITAGDASQQLLLPPPVGRPGSSSTPSGLSGLPLRAGEEAAAGPSVGPFQADHMPSGGGGGGDGGEVSGGVFAYLGAIMEEMRHIREAQAEILRRTADPAAPDLTPALRARGNEKLAGAPAELIDLAPRPVAVSWRARRRLRERLRPILHPIDGTRLDDTMRATGSLPGSMYGMRLEGVTVDSAIALPADLCLMFSFGPLPYQQVGPLRAASVERAATCETFQIAPGGDGGSDDGSAGFVWCEPIESLRDPATAKFKEEAAARGAVLYLHLYDALTMFYVATARLPLAHFTRPYAAVCALAPLDLALERDLTLTSETVPPEVYPAVSGAGQLHLTLFTVGVDASHGPVKSRRVRDPAAAEFAGPASAAAPCGAARSVIVARKLPHADRLSSASAAARDSEEMQPPHAAAGDQEAATPEKQLQGDGAGQGLRRTPPTPDRGPAGEMPYPASRGLHAQRAAYVKQALRERDAAVGPSPQLPGVPGAHVRQAQDVAELEYRLRLLEDQRDACKARCIADALLRRITVEHEVAVCGWRPETVRSDVRNPYGVPMQFFVQLARGEEVCEVAGGPSFYLGPHERGEVALVLRAPYAGKPETHHVLAYVFSETGERVRGVSIAATVAPPLVDRRYEIFGPAGSEVQRRLLSGALSAAALPLVAQRAELQQRLQGMCAYAATSAAEGTVVQTRAVVDPLTQSYVVCWEEALVQTRVPAAAGQQRTEYVTLFDDAAMTRVRETWELCVFACEAFTTREIPWGQTTSLGLPAEGVEDVYCSDPAVRVQRRGAAFILKVRPRAVGPASMLLHSLVAATGALKKTIVTVPCAHPTPSYTQVLELGPRDAAQPVFRRLTFVNRTDREDTFTVEHNYKYQLAATPRTFTLAPGDTQFVSLQIDMLSLPPGHREGRWPMWIFVNNRDDKTVESYSLQVVLRAQQPVSPITEVPPE